MNEKIIIDGVDVAGCKHYDNICYEEDIFPLNCKNQDCIYKQLKRLEQENEELKQFKKEVLKPLFLPNIEEEVTNTYRSALEKIREIANQTIIDYTEIAKNNEKLKALDLRNRINEIQNIITKAIGNELLEG